MSAKQNHNRDMTNENKKKTKNKKTEKENEKLKEEKIANAWIYMRILQLYINYRCCQNRGRKMHTNYACLCATASCIRFVVSVTVCCLSFAILFIHLILIVHFFFVSFLDFFYYFFSSCN